MGKSNKERTVEIDMIFESLYESAENGELILVNGGLCRYHIRRDKQLTIREIIVLPEKQGIGIGTSMLDILKKKNVDSIFAKCPAELPSNNWYKINGFILEDKEENRRGNKINHWRLWL